MGTFTTIGLDSPTVLEFPNESLVDRTSTLRPTRKENIV